MGFVVSGTVRGRAAKVAYSRGAFTGDAEAIRLAKAMESGGKCVMATHTGPCWAVNLSLPHVALVTILSLFDFPHTVAGRVPKLPGIAIPVGAVA